MNEAIEEEILAVANSKPVQRVTDPYDFIDQASQLIVGYSPESYDHLLTRLREMAEAEKNYRLIKNADEIVNAFRDAVSVYADAQGGAYD